MAVPNIFGTATAAIPLSQLDTNFATPVTIGNTAVQLGNTVTSFGNVTLTNVTISSGNVTITGANVSGTANVSTLVVTSNETVLGNTAVTGNITASLFTSLSTFGFKNRIINGAMVIDQRNAGAAVTPTTSNNVYPIDRFLTYATQSSKFTAQQNAGSVTPPVGFSNYLGFTSSSAYSILTGDFFLTAQRIEGFNFADMAWGTANAATVTLSFWVRSSLTGTFGGGLRNSANNRSYPFSYTISSANTWEQKTITIAGDTSGTWVGATNGEGVEILWSLGSGATYSTTSSVWSGNIYFSVTGATSVVGTNGATFYITGVQLEKGSTATSFDYRPYTTELQLAQRYYEKSFDIGTAVAQNSGTYNGTAVASSPGPLSGMAFGDTRYKVNKRTAATVTFYNPAAANAFARDQNAGVNCTATSAWMAGESSFAISASTPAGSGATNRIAVHWSADSEL